MIDRLISALAEALRESGFCVYTESVGQGLEKPCLFIECTKTEAVKLLGGRFFVRATVTVRYESDSDEKKYEADSVICELFRIMSAVEADGEMFLARGLRSERTKGDCLATCFYDLLPVWEEETAVMEKIETRDVLNG